MEITIDHIVSKLRTKLRLQLEEEGFDTKTIGKYIDAIHKAKNFCEQQFSEEYSKYGGQFTSHGPDHAARVTFQLFKRRSEGNWY